MIGVPNDQAAPIWRWFVIPGLILAMAYHCIKIEDCSITLSNDMKEDLKFKIKGDFGWLRSLEVISNVMFLRIVCLRLPIHHL